MAALRLLLVASLALQTLAVTGNADRRTHLSEGLHRAGRSEECPEGCPEELGMPNQLNTKKKLYMVSKSTTHAYLTCSFKTPIGPIRKENLAVGSKIVEYNESFESFQVLEGAIWYCHERQGVTPDCLPTRATTTTTITSTIASTTATITPAITSTSIPHDDSRRLHPFLATLSAASVLLMLLLVAKGCQDYRFTVTELNHRITNATEQVAATHSRKLHALRNAVILDFWLRLCLSILVVHACVCVYGLYLVCTHDDDLFVALFILGAMCLLLHGYFFIRKVSSVIRAMSVRVLFWPHPAPSRRSRHHDDEETGSESTLGKDAGCPSPVVSSLLQVCLLLLLICLCVLTYGLWHLMHGPAKI